MKLGPTQLLRSSISSGVPHLKLSSQTFFRFFVGVWVSVSCLSFLLFNGSMSEIKLSPGAFVCILIGALSSLLFEGTVIVFAIASFKMLLSFKSGFLRALGYLPVVCIGAVLSLFLLSIFVSWNLFVHQLGFISLSAVVSTLSDFPSIVPFFTKREIALLLDGSLVAMAFS